MPLTLIRRQSLPYTHCTNCSSCLPSTPYTSLSALSIGKRFCANCQRYLHRYCPMRLWLPIGDWRLHCRLHFKVFDLASSLPIDQPNWPSMSQSQSHTHFPSMPKTHVQWMQPMEAILPKTKLHLCCNLGWKQLIVACWQLLQLARNKAANEISSKLAS